MKVEDCIVSVERRTVGGCLDLAFVFAREFAGPLSRIWLLCAVPCCLLVGWLTSSRTDQLFSCILLFLLFSAVCGALLVCCAGPQVFGVPMSVRSAIRMWKRRFWSWLSLTVAMRFCQLLSGFCFVVPSIFVTAFAGFLPEVIFLEQAPANHVVPRLNWLSGGGGYSRNLSRSLILMGFWLMLAVSLFVMMDLVCDRLFHYPIFISRVSLQVSTTGEGLSGIWTTWFRMLSDDPRVAVTTQLAFWLPFPIIRLAWFFAYLDQRIRNECWDLQLQFRTEAARLEAVP